MQTMNSVFDVQDAIRALKANGDNESFGVFYQSKSNRSNGHYVIVKSENELANLKAFYREYDFIFNTLAV
jgi:hypothetical protein